MVPSGHVWLFCAALGYCGLSVGGELLRTSVLVSLLHHIETSPSMAHYWMAALHNRETFDNCLMFRDKQVNILNIMRDHYISGHGERRQRDETTVQAATLGRTLREHPKTAKAKE